MKPRFRPLAAFILASAVVGGAPALSQASKNTERINYVSREVAVPADLSSEAAKAAYTHKLMAAVDRVCWLAASPPIGGSYKAWQECLTHTALTTAAKDPTGLLAAQLGPNATSLAAAK